MRGLMAQMSCAVRALTDTRMLRPTVTITTFADLIIPENTRVVLLDKDNTFAAPHTLEVLPIFANAWKRCLAWQADEPGRHLAVLSNTAGYAAKDPNDQLAKRLEETLKIKVIRHSEPKPLCDAELVAKFKALGIQPNEIVVVGDRLMTDVLLANRMGARSVFLKLNSHPNLLNRLELPLWNYL